MGISGTYKQVGMSVLDLGCGTAGSGLIPFLLALIEHLRNPNFILDQCQYLMNNTTRLIITTPTRVGDLASRASERIWGNLKASDAHVRIYSRDTLNSVCKAHGLVYRYYRCLGWHRQNQLAIYTKTSALDITEKQQ